MTMYRYEEIDKAVGDAGDLAYRHQVYDVQYDVWLWPIGRPTYANDLRIVKGVSFRDLKSQCAMYRFLGHQRIEIYEADWIMECLL
jgi:hypothetical protein